MSRSEKKSPGSSILNIKAGEMKYWKKKCNKKLRSLQDLENFSAYKRQNERYLAPDDGKFYAHEESKWISNPEDIKKIKRK